MGNLDIILLGIFKNVSFRSSAFLKDSIQVRIIYGESEHHSLKQTKLAKNWGLQTSRKVNFISTLLEIFKNIDGCVMYPSQAQHFSRIRHRCYIIYRKYQQHCLKHIKLAKNGDFRRLQMQTENICCSESSKISWDP